MTDAAPPTPNFYLKQAQTSARSVRSWIHRYTKLHPEDPDPDGVGPGSNRVGFVLDTFDALEDQLERAVTSADHHVPTAGSPTTSVERQQVAQHGLNLHRLKVMTDRTRAMSRWVNTARWSTGVKPGDLDQLDSLIRELTEHLGHLQAEAEETELAR